MKAKALFVTMLVFAAAFIAVIPAETDDAAVTNMYIEGGNSITVDKDKGTTLTVHYTADKNVTSVVSLVNTTTGATLWSTTMIFQVGEDETFTVPLETASYPNGPVQLKLTFSNSVYGDISFTVNFTTSIWSNWTIYAVIAVIIILVAALIIYKSRSAPKNKNQLTFEQVEAMKQAERTSTSTERKAPVRSERQRYLASKKK